MITVRISGGDRDRVACAQIAADICHENEDAVVIDGLRPLDNIPELPAWVEIRIVIVADAPPQPQPPPPDHDNVLGGG